MSTPCGPQLFAHSGNSFRVQVLNHDLFAFVIFPWSDRMIHEVTRTERTKAFLLTVISWIVLTGDGNLSK